MTRYLLLFHNYCCVFVGRPLWRKVGSVDCQSESAFLSQLSVYIYIYIFTFQMFNIQICIHTLYLRPQSVWTHYSNLFPNNSCSRCHGSLRHLNGHIGDRLQVSASSIFCVGFCLVQYCIHFQFRDYE
jgi:hypothetical protein